MLLEPLHNAQPLGIAFAAPDHINIAPVGIPVDPAELGLPITEISGTILGAWLFGPFDQSTGDTPWSIRWETSGLSESEQVQLYNSSYDDHAWLDAGTATSDEDGVLNSNEGAGLQYLTGLLIVRP